METIQLRERSSPDARCAYCHGLLDDTTEVSQCKRCHVELHEDCRKALGRCPTLGCTARALAPIDLPRLHHARFTGTRIPRARALAALYARSALASFLSGIIALVLFALPVAVSIAKEGPLRASSEDMTLFLLVLPIVGLASYIGFVSTRHLRTVFRASELVGQDPGEERSLVVVETALGHRIVGLEADEGQPGPPWMPIDLELHLGRLREGREPVRVRGLGSSGCLVIEHANGELEIAQRLGHPALRPPDFWSRRSRRRPQHGR